MTLLESLGKMESERQTTGNFSQKHCGSNGKNKFQQGGPSTMLWDFSPGDECMCNGDFQGSPTD